MILLRSHVQPGQSLQEKIGRKTLQPMELLVVKGNSCQEIPGEIVLRKNRFKGGRCKWQLKILVKFLSQEPYEISIPCQF